MKDVIKLVVILILYAGVAPMLAKAFLRNRGWERAALCLMLFMTSWQPGKVTLMIDSIETYRGHTKGFEYAHFDTLSLAILLASRWRSPPAFPRWPPGTGLYMLYCFVATLSFFPALNKVYALMGIWKFTKAILWYAAAFHAFRDDDDLKWVMRTLAGMVIFQALVGLKMRFLEGSWQVKGWFEHQNPMAMWCYLCCFPVLAWAFNPRTSKSDTALCLGGVAAGALLILLSVSRAGLGMFAVGCTGVTGMAWLRGPKPKTIGITSLGALGALAAGLLALDAFMARMAEVKSRDEAEDLRAIMIKQAKMMLHDSTFGIGWNNYGIADSLPYTYSQPLIDWDESRGFRIIEENYLANPLTESLYWLILGETGYPGFFTYLLFLVATLHWAVRSSIYFRKSATGWFAGAVTIGLALQYYHGTVERVFSQTKNLAIWLLLAGMMARLETLRRARRDLLPTSQP
jgi:hypothetical protein